jgi:hypothetical protein
MVRVAAAILGHKEKVKCSESTEEEGPTFPGPWSATQL